MNPSAEPLRVLLLDLSGVLYDGDQVIPGAQQALEQARERDLTLRFVTNTATKSRTQILNKLTQMGFSLSSDELFTAPDAARAYLEQHQLTPYALVHSRLKPDFDARSLGEPNCVVLGDAREDLSYANLNRAFGLIQQGCPLIAIGENKYFLENGTLSLDAGPFVHALAWAADIEPIVMGKPSRTFFEQVVASTSATAEQCLMIGDDIFGDVEGALNAGLQARLVKTGKYRPGDEHRLQPQAQTLNSIANLKDLL